MSECSANAPYVMWSFYTKGLGVAFTLSNQSGLFLFNCVLYNHLAKVSDKISAD